MNEESIDIYSATNRQKIILITGADIEIYSELTIKNKLKTAWVYDSQPLHCIF